MTARLLPRLATAASALVLAASLTASLTACGTDAAYDASGAGKPAFEPATSGAVASSPLFASYSAADALLRNLGHFPDLRKPILVATLVNINDLQASSGFGRMSAEQIGARLANSGLPVAEIKLRDSILVQEGKGELMLSRDARALAHSRGAQALVVGTYATGHDAVYVNVRMVSASDGRVLSAVDYVVPMTRDVAALVSSDINAALGLTGNGAIVY
jgi:TolB-like protein